MRSSFHSAEQLNEGESADQHRALINSNMHLCMTCLYISPQLYQHAHTHTHTQARTHTHTHTHTPTHAGTQARTHKHTHTHLLPRNHPITSPTSHSSFSHPLIRLSVFPSPSLSVSLSLSFSISISISDTSLMT